MDRAHSSASDQRPSGPGRVAFITINIGVNDLLNACLDDAAGALDPACARGLLPEVQANLGGDHQTRGDAAPGVSIAGMSYWDPFLGFWITGPEGEVRARTSNQAMQVLNAGLVPTYRGEVALVADWPDLGSSTSPTSRIRSPAGGGSCTLMCPPLPGLACETGGRS